MNNFVFVVVFFLLYTNLNKVVEKKKRVGQKMLVFSVLHASQQRPNTTNDSDIEML